LAAHRRDKTIRITRELRLDGALDAAQRARLADIAERTPVTLLVKRGRDRAAVAREPAAGGLGEATRSRYGSDTRRR
jgi:hypothetical protein